MSNISLLRLSALCIFALLYQPALAAPQPWVKLTPLQQEALAPLSNDWDAIPEKQQRTSSCARSRPRPFARSMIDVLKRRIRPSSSVNSAKPRQKPIRPKRLSQIVQQTLDSPARVRDMKKIDEAMAKNPKLTEAQKQRMNVRLKRWSKLTPEQRTQARDKFRAFSKVPMKQREQVKEMIDLQEEVPIPQPAASGVSTGKPTP